jgi:hypothetical protein
MSLDVHTTSVAAGSASPSKPDRVQQYTAFGVANLAGGSAGAAVTTAVAVPVAAGLPSSNYFVDVEVSQACTAHVTNKTATGFNVVLTPNPATATLGAGTFNVNITF